VREMAGFLDCSIGDDESRKFKVKPGEKGKRGTRTKGGE